MKISKIIVTLFLVLTILINNFYYQPQKVEAVFVLDDITIALIATGLVATGVTITALNKDGIAQWCTDLYNNASTGIANWVNFNKTTTLVGGMLISNLTSNVTGQLSSYLDTKPKNATGELVIGNEYFTRVIGGIQCLKGSSFPNYTSENMRKLVNTYTNIDVGFNNNINGVNYSLLVQPVSGTNFADLIGTYIYNGSINNYGNISRRYDTSFKPIIYMYDGSFTNLAYTDVFYFKMYYKNTSGNFVTEYVFSALDLPRGGFAIGTTPITTAPSTYKVPYSRSTVGTSNIATPSSIDSLIGKTANDVLTNEVVPTTTTIPTATPSPTTAPINTTLSLPWSGSWTGNFVSNPANLRFGSATGSLTGDCVGTWTGTISNTGVFSGSCVLADTTLLTGTVTSSIALTSDFSIPQGGLNFSPLKVAGASLTTKFPFCIPFDFIKSFSAFSSANVSIPRWEIPMPMNNKLVLDLVCVDPLAPLSRWLFLILFNLGLIIAVNKIYGGVL